MSLPRAPDGKNVVIQGAYWNRVLDIIEKGDNWAVAAPLQMHESSAGRALSIEKHEQTWVKIVSSSRDGSNFRWTYTVKLAVRTTTAFAAWGEITGNLTAYNSLERMNGASGLMGNGVDTANLSGTGLTLQPAPAGAIVRATFEFDAWIFEYSNGVDGTCTP